MAKPNKKSKAHKRWKQRQKRASEHRPQRTVASPDDGVKYQAYTGSDKMSDRLVAVAGDLLEAAESLSDAKGALQTAMVGWNMAILSEDKREIAFAKIVNSHEGTIKRALVAIIIDRKTAMYPDDRRMIHDVHVKRGQGEWLVEAVYYREPLPTQSKPPAQG